jgi:hypothetical protein
MQPIPFVVRHNPLTYLQRRPSLKPLGCSDAPPSHRAGRPRGAPECLFPRAGRGVVGGSRLRSKSNSPPRPPFRVEPLRIPVATAHGPAMGGDRIERFGAAAESADGPYSAVGISRNAKLRPAAGASMPEHQSSHRSPGGALSWRNKLPALIDSLKRLMRRDRADIPLMTGVVAQEPRASL